MGGTPETGGSTHTTAGNGGAVHPAGGNGGAVHPAGGNGGTVHPAGGNGGAVDSAGGSAGEGGAVDTAGGSGGEGGGEHAPSCQGLDGSYDLELAPDFAADDPDAITRFTVQLEETAVGCRASVAPEFYPESEALVEIGESSVRLLPTYDSDSDFEATVLAMGWYWGLTFFREYYFHEFDLARDGAELGPAATARGSTAAAEDDIAWTDAVDYVGTLTRDARAPQIEVSAAAIDIPVPPPADFASTGGERRPGLPEELLPWDTVEVRASEPLVGLLDALSVVGNDDVVWAPATQAAEVTTDDTWAWARFGDWDAVAGTTQTIAVAAGLEDAVGRPFAAAEFPLEVLDVPPAVEQHDFDDATTVASFGELTQGDGFVTATAPCNSGVGGVAGRLITENAVSIEMRARADSALLFTVVGSNGREYDELEISAADDDDYRIYTILLDGVSEVGFTVVPNSMCHWTVNANVDIDWIRTQPAV